MQILNYWCIILKLHVLIIMLALQIMAYFLDANEITREFLQFFVGLFYTILHIFQMIGMNLCMLFLLTEAIVRMDTILKWTIEFGFENPKPLWTEMTSFICGRGCLLLQPVWETTGGRFVSMSTWKLRFPATTSSS